MPAVLLGLIVVIGFIIELRIFVRRRLPTEQNRDHGSFLAMITAVLLSLMLLVIFSCWEVGCVDLPAIISWMGLVIMIGGFGLRQWSIQVLKNFFTPTVCLQPDQTLIDAGPYTYMRHPSYLGLIMELVGLGLTTKNILAVAVVLGLMIPAVLYRIGVEEKALIEKFGQTYIDYKRRTKKLLPI